jgi:hypothetical protein
MNALIELGYWIAKYEAIDNWTVELEKVSDTQWSLRWAGSSGNVDGEETSIGTAEELALLMRRAIEDSEQPRCIRFASA